MLNKIFDNRPSVKPLGVFCALALLAACGSSGGGVQPGVSSSSASSSSSEPSSSSSSSSSSSQFSSVPVVLDCAYEDNPVQVTGGDSRIEAENYDQCDDSYSDTTSGNSGSVYRDQDVDLMETVDGYALTDTATGEFLEYSVEVQTSGLYVLSYRVSHKGEGDAAELVLLTNGQALESTRTQVATDSADWHIVTSEPVYLTDGPQVLRLNVVAGGAELDYLEFGHAEPDTLEPRATIGAMGIGINLGNTLDAPYEGDWAPAAQKKYFEAFEKAGFHHVRIPATWDNHTADAAPYQVDAERMNRTEQVVDWALAQGYYVILNAHHEDWLQQDYSAANRARFDAIWTQVAERFNNKSPRLMLEILNEPVGMTSAQVNDLNKRILGIIRAQNPTRLVVYSGHGYTPISSLIEADIPSDDYLLGNFHSYDPWAFAGQCTRGWGSDQDLAELTAIYQTAKDWSTEHDIPVMVNEFGAAHYDYNQPQNVCELQDRLDYLRAHVNLAIEMGLAATVWDDNESFGIYDREAGEWGPEKDVLVAPNP